MLTLLEDLESQELGWDKGLRVLIGSCSPGLADVKLAGGQDQVTGVTDRGPQALVVHAVACLSCPLGDYSH